MEPSESPVPAATPAEQPEGALAEPTSVTAEPVEPMPVPADQAVPEPVTAPPPADEAAPAPAEPPTAAAPAMRKPRFGLVFAGILAALVVIAAAVVLVVRPWEAEDASRPGSAAAEASASAAAVPFAEELPDPCSLELPRDLKRVGQRFAEAPRAERTKADTTESLKCGWAAAWAGDDEIRQVAYTVTLTLFYDGAEPAGAAYANHLEFVLQSPEPVEGVGDAAAVETATSGSVRMVAREGNVLLLIDWRGDELPRGDVKEALGDVAADAFEAVEWR